MSNSDSTPKQTDEAGASYRGGMSRAVFSAAVFGVIGAYFGKWLGKRGNADGSHMAEPIMKWSMGAFWAVLAAYASLKASEPLPREQTPSEPKPKAREKQSTIRDYSTVVDMNQAQANLEIPSVQVQQATAAMHGLVQEHAPQMAVQK